MEKYTYDIPKTMAKSALLTDNATIAEREDIVTSITVEIKEITLSKKHTIPIIPLDNTPELYANAGVAKTEIINPIIEIFFDKFFIDSIFIHMSNLYIDYIKIFSPVR